jgi:hypothetical protein
MNIDITQALKDTENSLRDLITNILSKAFGDDWKEQCGLPPERIQKWKQRKEDEGRRQKGGVVEERLIYYADFYDLKTILSKNWSRFLPALGEWNVMRVYLGELEKLRDPDAHRRELLPHQKHLAAGIAGEIRTRLIRYRSKEETSEDYFPRIESARDSLGNIWTATSPDPDLCNTKTTLRPGDVVDFLVTASDPLGEELYFALEKGSLGSPTWQTSNTFSVTIEEDDIGDILRIEISVKSGRNHHAGVCCDQSVSFYYSVLPKKTTC